MSSLRKRVSTDDFELIDRDDWQCDGGSAEGVGQQLDGGSDCFSEPDNTFSKVQMRIFLQLFILCVRCEPKSGQKCRGLLLCEHS